MHQHLKSTYSLSLPCNNENEGWQTLVATAAYGTFFTISGRFHFDEKEKFSPKSCDLHLQNYSGNVTIGLVEVEPEIQLVEDTLLDTSTFVLIIKLKALHANNKILNAPVTIAKNTFSGEKTTQFSTNNSLKIEVLFESVDGFNINNHEASNFIDESIAMREGDDLVIPDYSKRFHYDLMTHYKEYFEKKHNDTTLNVKLKQDSEESMIGIKTVTLNNKTKKDVFRTVEVYDKNGNLKHSQTFLRPYPCSHCYVRFVK